MQKADLQSTRVALKQHKAAQAGNQGSKLTQGVCPDAPVLPLELVQAPARTLLCSFALCGHAQNHFMRERYSEI